MKGGIGQLMKHAQQMQAELQKAQEEMASVTVCGESGGGLVKVVMSCKHQLKDLAIDDSLLGDDKDMLEDLIIAACNDAVRKVEATIQDRFSGLTSGLGLPPGFKLPF